MKRYSDVLILLLELRRLMQRTGVTRRDALGLLIDQLRCFEEAEQMEEDLQHAEFPRQLYGL